MLCECRYRILRANTKKPIEESMGFENFGGAEEDRTPDLRIANATLSQLSYRPNWSKILACG